MSNVSPAAYQEALSAGRRERERADRLERRLSEAADAMLRDAATIQRLAEQRDQYKTEADNLEKVRDADIRRCLELQGELYAKIAELKTALAHDRDRASAFIIEASGGNLGAGYDPVGFLIASHAMIAGERAELQAQVAAFAEAAKGNAK